VHAVPLFVVNVDYLSNYTSVNSPSRHGSLLNGEVVGHAKGCACTRSGYKCTFEVDHM